MHNDEQDRGGSRFPGGKIKDFFSWLRGFGLPKYIPQRSRYGDSHQKKAAKKSDLDKKY